MKVPTSVLVICILGILYGALGILMAPVSAALAIWPVGNDPVTPRLMNDAFYLANFVVSLSIYFLVSVLLLVSSIGSLRLRPWGRRGMIAYAWINMVFSICNTVVGILLVPTITKAAAGSPMENLLIWSTLGSMCLGLVPGIGIPAIILWFFSRPRTRDAFQGIFPAPPTPFPVEYPPPT